MYLFYYLHLPGTHECITDDTHLQSLCAADAFWNLRHDRLTDMGPARSHIREMWWKSQGGLTGTDTLWLSTTGPKHSAATKRTSGKPVHAQSSSLPVSRNAGGPKYTKQREKCKPHKHIASQAQHSDSPLLKTYSWLNVDTSLNVTEDVQYPIN